MTNSSTIGGKWMAAQKVTDKQFYDIIQTVDIDKLKEAIKASFYDFKDARIPRRILYPAWYLFLILICGYLAGNDTLTDIVEYAQLKEGWFRSLNDQGLGVPSYDTLRWFLVRTKPEAFKNLLKRWISNLPLDLRDKLLVIDGKRLKGISDNEHITHIVELFAAERQIVLAQEKVPQKSDEKTSVEQLLGAVNVEGALISGDALYCYLPVLCTILRAGADYLVGLKENQPKLRSWKCCCLVRSKMFLIGGIFDTHLYSLDLEKFNTKLKF